MKRRCVFCNLILMSLHVYHYNLVKLKNGSLKRTKTKQNKKQKEKKERKYTLSILGIGKATGIDVLNSRLSTRVGSRGWSNN